MNRELQEKVQAWVDGELGAAEARTIANLVETNPEAAELAGNLKGFSRLLRDHEPAHAVTDSREFYWSRIRRGIELAEAKSDDHAKAGSPRIPSAFRWLAWLVPAAAASLAVFFAVRPGPPITPQRSAQAQASAQAMVGHVVEDTLPQVNTLTFYSASDEMTVVWVDHADIL